MTENNFPAEKDTGGEELNPFMGRNIENNPFKMDPAENPFKGYERPTPAKKAEPQKTEKTKEGQSIFKGAYQATTAKVLNWIIGRDRGYKDFTSFTNVSPAVRDKMRELKGRIVPKNKEYINKMDFQREVNKIRREMSYSTGNDRTAREQLLKEIENKTGIKPKIY